MNLTKVQTDKSKELAEIITRNNLAILNGETRSGKTLTALNCAELLGKEDVLIITKKKAISSIQDDYNAFGFTYKLTVINYASAHKIERNNFDFIILDEVHSCSSFPKPSVRTKMIRDNFSHIPMLVMSGTMAAESASQYYHELWVSNYSPFSQYKSFYKWANVFVNKVQKEFGTHKVTDYSGAKVDEVMRIIDPLMVTMTRKEAGIEMEANENIISVEVPDHIKKLANRLMRERAVEGKEYVLMGDTPASLQTKVHQIFNGSVIVETLDGEETKTIVLSDYKAKFIQQHFAGNKLAIMYYYKAEIEILRSVFGEGITTELEEFNNTDKHIALQQNTIEGMNLSAADVLVFMNWGFSGKNYLQALTRLTIRGRKHNEVYFLCEKGGINGRILKVLRDKKSYNSLSFKKDFLY